MEVNGTNYAMSTTTAWGLCSLQQFDIEATGPGTVTKVTFETWDLLSGIVVSAIP